MKNRFYEDKYRYLCCKGCISFQPCLRSTLDFCQYKDEVQPAFEAQIGLIACIRKVENLREIFEELLH